MKRALLVLCVLCVAWQSPPAPKPHTAKPDSSSPEAIARSRERQVACISNVKLVALAALMLNQDRKEKFALKAASYKKSLMPYTKNKQIFHCPEDKSGAVSYSFNRNLEGISLYKIDKPAETVMIYEGKNQKLAFRHNGGANVGFVDGHVKWIPKEKAKTLRWKP